MKEFYYDEDKNELIYKDLPINFSAEIVSCTKKGKSFYVTLKMLTGELSQVRVYIENDQVMYTEL